MNLQAEYHAASELDVPRERVGLEAALGTVSDRDFRWLSALPVMWVDVCWSLE